MNYAKGLILSVRANQPPSPLPSEIRVLSCGLLKGNQCFLLSPDHKAGYFCGWYVRGRVVDQS